MLGEACVRSTSRLRKKASSLRALFRAPLRHDTMPVFRGGSTRFADRNHDILVTLTVRSWRLACLPSAGRARPTRARCTHRQQRERPMNESKMQTPPVVSKEAWEAARQAMLVKEKSFTRARDALAAERRRMPWMAVEKAYAFEGPQGKLSLIDLFEGRRQLIVYRAFFEPGVFGWPDHACRGCSLG